MSRLIRIVSTITSALAMAGGAMVVEAGQRETSTPGPALATMKSERGPERWISPTDLEPAKLVPIPVDGAVERRAHVQPTAPTTATEVPYVETVPEPALTDAEKQRGYLLFGRPTVEPVYPNTHPLPTERLEAIIAFAAAGQFQPVTLALYPVRPLVNLKVRVSSLRCPAGEIPADRVDVRLATYWKVGFPRYTTVNTFRRTPELAGAGDRPLLSGWRVPALLAHDPCP